MAMFQSDVIPVDIDTAVSSTGGGGEEEGEDGSDKRVVPLWSHLLSVRQAHKRRRAAALVNTAKISQREREREREKGKRKKEVK